MNSQRGFTLLELLVAVAVAAILVLQAVPAFGSFFNGSLTSVQVNEFVSDIQLARSEALKRNGRVSVCPTSDGSNCSGSSDWATGWLVFTDTTGTRGDFDGTDELIIVREGVKGNIALNSGGDTSIQFLSSGYTSNYNDASASNVSFTMKPMSCEGMNQREIVITRYGHLALTKTDCS